MANPELALLDAGNITLGLRRGLAKLSGSITGAIEVVFPVASVKGAYKSPSQLGIKFIKEPRPVTSRRWGNTAHITLQLQIVDILL